VPLALHVKNATNVTLTLVYQELATYATKETQLYEGDYFKFSRNYNPIYKIIAEASDHQLKYLPFKEVDSENQVTLDFSEQEPFLFIEYGNVYGRFPGFSGKQSKLVIGMGVFACLFILVILCIVGGIIVQRHKRKR